MPDKIGGSNRVLIIAYHFPPCVGSSGLLRSEKFARYLPEFGWVPIVLTLHPRAYESVDQRTLAGIPKGLVVLRSFAVDTKRHLGFRGSYADFLALPDRWVAWLFGALPLGLHAIRKHHVKAIFSTFPISTAVLIGFVLHRLTRTPWIVDLRDSMTEEDYPKNITVRRVRRWIEAKAVKYASRIIFTAPSTLKMYRKRYPDLSEEKCVLIPNGYDEQDFVGLRERAFVETSADSLVRLLHTGLIYPEERDPRPFFAALSRLKREGKISNLVLRVSFRAAGSESLFQRMIDHAGISDIVKLQPHVPYHQALQECAHANALLVFQAANCDHQIPAKVYEYLRLRKPIFALTSHSGDTAALLKEIGGATIANLSEEQDIYVALPNFLAAVRKGLHSLPDSDKIRRYARRAQAGELAICLSNVAANVLSSQNPERNAARRPASIHR
jgi:glycosyltransferase involved in cell wall biosynthesis